MKRYPRQLTVVPYAVLISLHAGRVCGILLFHIEKLEKYYGSLHGACDLLATCRYHVLNFWIAAYLRCSARVKIYITLFKPRTFRLIYPYLCTTRVLASMDLFPFLCLTYTMCRWCICDLFCRVQKPWVRHCSRRLRRSCLPSIRHCPRFLTLPGRVPGLLRGHSIARRYGGDSASPGGIRGPRYFF